MKYHFQEERNFSIDFITDNENNTDDKWNKYLGHYGLIPHKLTKYIQETLDDKNKNTTKMIIEEITTKIMEMNIKIWKHRCKKLYGGNIT